VTPAFLILALVILVSATAAMSLRNPVHCALSLVVTFAGLAGVYLQLGAQFVGLAQVLVYIGAVAILIVFAILLTHGREAPQGAIPWRPPLIGIGIAVLVFGALAASVLSSSAVRRAGPVATEPVAAATVQNIGQRLMTEYLLPFEVIGLLLTATLIGAVIVAMKEKAQ